LILLLFATFTLEPWERTAPTKGNGNMATLFNPYSIAICRLIHGRLRARQNRKGFGGSRQGVGVWVG
jgi:hypothetical protein